MPVPTPLNCQFPAELFGDILMVLEYMTCFNDLFDLEDEFPEGIDLGKDNLQLSLWRIHDNNTVLINATTYC